MSSGYVYKMHLDNKTAYVKEVRDRPETDTTAWKELDTRGVVMVDPVSNQRRRLQDLMDRW